MKMFWKKDVDNFENKLIEFYQNTWSENGTPGAGNSEPFYHEVINSYKRTMRNYVLLGFAVGCVATYASVIGVMFYNYDRNQQRASRNHY